MTGNPHRLPIFLALVAGFAALPSGCGEPGSPGAAAGVARARDAGEAAQARPEPRTLTPGANITAAVLEELGRDPTRPPAAAQAAAPDLELGADRPLTPVDLPVVPRGSTASFTFGPGQHRGWVTRLPSRGHIPSVAYGAGRVYASGGFDTIAFYALASDTGRLQWERHDLEDNGPTAPLYDEEDGGVIFNTESCTLFVLDARSGRTRWKRWLGDPTLAQPALSQGLIYAAYPAQGGTRLGAFTLRSGRQVWSRSVSGELLSAPVAHGGAVYATTIHGRVYRFEGKSGKLRWSRALRATSAPWVEGDRVYLSRATRRGGHASEAQVVLDAASGAPLTEVRAVPARYLADVPRTLESWPRVWAFEGSRPLVFGGRLLYAMGGAVNAADLSSGRALWQRSQRDAGDRRAFSPPVLAGTQLVVSGGQTLYALDVDTGMTVFAYKLSRKLAAAPVVARGWVYLTTVDGAVVGLHVGGPELDGWHMWGGGPGHNGRG